MREMVIFIIVFDKKKKRKIKRLIDNAVHDLLDINIMHFTLLSMFVVTKTGIIFMITSM